jgi:alpha-glucosidase
MHMRREPSSLRVFAGLMAGFVLAAFSAFAEPAEVASPDGRLIVSVESVGGQPRYAVRYDGRVAIEPSRLGLRFAAGQNLDEGLEVGGVSRTQHDETWEQPWGEQRVMRDHHNEMAVSFARAGKTALVLRVRAFDDGLGFRYEVPADALARNRQITDEITEFRIPGKAKAWWIPGGRWNRYEYLYQTTTLDAVSVAHTPITLKPEAGPYLSIHEAALVDYAAMWIDQRRPGVLRSVLSPRGDGAGVTVSGAFKTPWRTIQVADSAVGLINSSLVLNLNEPNKLGDVSWVKPGKYIGIWWGMHINKWTWGSGPKHGATTENTKRYIDFAAAHGFDGVLVEGWNEGWDGDWFNNGEVFSFTKPYKDFDLEGLAAYARGKGVRLVGHHETSAAVTNYENQLDAALDLYARLGVNTIKTGYVADGGGMSRRDAQGNKRYEWHDNQFAVAHHLRVVEKAAKRRIMIMPHEPVKDTGLRRTYPNWMSREGARGQEYNAWGSPPNPPEHVALLPFTRLLSGPMDYTPGIFDLMPNGPQSENRVQSTLAQQLAHYVVIYSPLQMAADLPENYEKRMDAFQFIKDVPTDWERSIALSGEIGDYIVMARQKRGGRDWYIGALTDEAIRDVRIDLKMLEPGVTYVAEIYRDGPGADWKSNPYAIVIERRTVRAGDVLTFQLGAGGGAALRLTPQS